MKSEPKALPVTPGRCRACEHHEGAACMALAGARWPEVRAWLDKHYKGGRTNAGAPQCPGFVAGAGGAT